MEDFGKGEGFLETQVYLLSWLDWLSVVVYLGILAAMGYYFSRRQNGADEYFVGKRDIPGWAVGISMFATLLSSFTFIAFPGFAYDRSWEILMREFMAPICVAIAAVTVIPIYRQAIRMSAYEYLERRFGYAARVYGNLGFMFGHFFKISVVMFTMSVALNSITGWDITTIIVILGAVTVVYTSVGGIKGVIWTDVIQGILMLGTGLMTVAYLVFIASPSPGTLFAEAAQDGKFRLINPEFSMTKETVYVFMFFGMFQFLTKYGTDQTMVQRYLLSPSRKDTVRAMFISVACCMVAWITFSLIGSLLYGFYQINADRLPEGMKGDKVFPYFIARELPIGVTGLVLAGLFSATMSTLSSDLNSVGAVVIGDYYDRFAKNPTDKGRFRLSLGIVVGAGVVSVAVAILLATYKGNIMQMTMDAATIIGTLISGGILAAFVLGFFCRRANAKGLYTAIISGFIVGGWCLWTGAKGDQLPSSLSFLEYRLHMWWLWGFSNIFVFVVGYLVSIAFGKGELVDERLTVYGYRNQSAADEHAGEQRAQDGTHGDAVERRS